MKTILTLSDIQIQNPLPATSPRTIDNVLFLVFGVLGGISLIILVWAGMKYTLSGGDPTKTAEAKNQILYAAVGLAVALSAGAIVQVAAGKL